MTEIQMPGHNVEDATHRADCEACATLWAELERISAEAARLPVLRPARDLWAGIESRIDGASSASPARTWLSPAAPQGASAPQAPRIATPLFSRPRLRLAIAASLLVAATSAITWQIASRGATAATSVDLAAAVDGETAAELNLVSFQASVRSMDEEIAELEAIVADRRSMLDPKTITVLEQNLRLIDRAISESRAALVADPASRFLSEQFTRAYTSKITLLRDAATLPIGI